MNKRYQTIINQIKTWTKEGKEDIQILRALYSQVHLEENGLVSRNEDLKKGTKYSNLSNEEFAKLFVPSSFNKMERMDTKHLFQELHNRYMHDKGYEPTRNVAVISNRGTTSYGYVCYSDDLLFVNKDAMDKAKYTAPNTSNMNKTNLGISLMFVIMHESQHVAQFETALDFAMGVKQNRDDAFLGAMGVIKNTNFEISNNKNDKYIDEWKKNYDYRFVEHNANFSAFKKAMNEIPESERKGVSFDQYNAFTTNLSLRMKQTDKLSIERRLREMEKVAISEIDYFNKGAKKCPLKDKTIKTVIAYMKKDENGNSRFRTIMRKQLTELAETSAQAQKNLKGQKILTL